MDPAGRPRALSAVMAAGVLAGVFGPQLVTYTMDLWPPHVFAATYLAQAAVAALSALVLLGVELPRLGRERGGHDPSGVGVDGQVQLAPRPARADAVLLAQSLAGPAQLQSRAVHQQVHRLDPAGCTQVPDLRTMLTRPQASAASLAKANIRTAAFGERPITGAGQIAYLRNGSMSKIYIHPTFAIAVWEMSDRLLEKPARDSHTADNSNAVVNTNSPPLAVDLDGTLVVTDLLHEAIVGCVRLDAAALRNVISSVRDGKAAFKAAVYRRQIVDPDLVPYNQPLIAYLRDQRRAGRTIGLFTAADRSVADAVARHVGLFSVVCASDGVTNLSGRSKLQAIRATFGERFAYAGNADVDHAIFDEAEQAILVGPVDRLRADLSPDTAVEAAFPVPRAGLSTWLRALRLRHWSKNVLVFASPMLGLHLSMALAVQSVLLFVLFGLIASATYLCNDLLDLSSDRRHPEKRFRPFASGAIPARDGVAAASGLLVTAFAASSALMPWQVTATLLTYLAITLAYSVTLKRQPFIDVVVLASLFTLRVLAGSVLVPDRVSPWLLTFSTFFFGGLAMVKRYAELDRVVQGGGAGVVSRGYTAKDLSLLLASGVGATFTALSIFTVYLISNQYPRDVYKHPELLWAMVPALLLWTLRVWHFTVQGRMNEDPVIYALKDRFSVLLGAFVGSVLVAAWL